MAVSSGHSAVTTPAALELDRNLRYQLLDAILRPAQVRYFRDQLNQTIAAADSQNPVGGRFQWIKRVFARLLRPFQVQQCTFNHLVTDRLAELYDFIVSLTNARADVLTILTGELKERLDEVRTEMFLEMRALLPAQEAAADARAYVSLRSLGEAPRLYLGAASTKHAGYVTVDVQPRSEVDLVAPLDQLPTRPGTVAEIVADHVIERYSSVEVAHRLLPHWVSMLNQQGRLVLITGDLEAVIESLKAGSIDQREFVRCLFGSQARAVDSYRSAYTPKLLTELVASCGLTRAAITNRRRQPNELTFEFTLEAHKSALAVAA